MGEETDFRVRVAREKRERMRVRLLAATMELYAVSGPFRPPVIDDVVRQAGVSRGTFYQYFASVEEIVGELGRDMADEMIRSMEPILDDLTDPGARMAASPLIPLMRAAMEPRWAALISRVDYVEFLVPSSAVGRTVAGELMRAREAGILSFTATEPALDLIVGSIAEGARRLGAQPLGPSYATELSRMILAGLGMESGHAAASVAAAGRRLDERRAEFPWWHAAVD